ncbi:MAG: hypothetical protein AAE977_05335 [Thermoplasmataceae archaeon]|jgi:hypothetical protein
MEIDSKTIIAYRTDIEHIQTGIMKIKQNVRDIDKFFGNHLQQRLKKQSLMVFHLTAIFLSVAKSMT